MAETEMVEPALSDLALMAGLAAMERDRIQGFHYPPRFVIRDLARPFGEQEIWACPDLVSNRDIFHAQCEIERFRLGYCAVRKALQSLPALAHPDTPAT